MSNQDVAPHNKEKMEKLLKRYARRSDVATALRCSVTYVNKLVAKYGLEAHAQWRRDYNE